MVSENVGSMQRTRWAPVLHKRTRSKQDLPCELQDKGVDRFLKRKADSLDSIFSSLDSDIYGGLYGLWIKHNEVNVQLSQQILLPTFDGNGSERRGTGVSNRLKVWMKEKKGMDIICVRLISHHATESVRHKLATGSFKKQKYLHRSGVKDIPLHWLFLLYKTTGNMQDDWERVPIKFDLVLA